MLNPETITVLDPACGSGHILVEAYDVLKAIYLERGYRMRDIPRLILEKNLYGLDIDERAAQLAGFALLMKARADDRRLLENPPKLNVLALQESKGLDADEIIQSLNTVHAEPFDVTQDRPVEAHHIRQLVDTFAHAKTFGSLIQIPPDLNAQLPAMDAALQLAIQSGDLLAQAAALNLLPLVRQAKILGMQFDAVVANPPYMGGKGMNAALKDYAKRTFPDSKSDLFAMFIERGFELCKPSGFNSMVTMQSWMFLSSFQAMRENLLSNRTINTMAHLGARAFSEISGEVVQTTAFVSLGQHFSGYNPVFFRLVEGEEEQKETALRSNQNRFDKTVQDDFKKISGSPMAYWISQKMRNTFGNNKLFSDYFFSDGLTKTGNNEKYLRFHWELNYVKVTNRDNYRICVKGGDARSYFGNIDVLVNWHPEVRAHYRSDNVARITPEYLWETSGISWTKISSKGPTFRWFGNGMIAETGGPAIFAKESASQNLLWQGLGFLSSKVSWNILTSINPTLNFQTNDVLNLPFNVDKTQSSSVITEKLIQGYKLDWNNYETSWDFTDNPLIRQKQNTPSATISPVIPAVMPEPLDCASESIYRNENLLAGTPAQSSICADVALPSMALDSGIPAGMTAFSPVGYASRTITSDQCQPEKVRNAYPTLEASYQQWQTQNRAAIIEMQRLEEENNRLFIEAYGLQDELSPEVPEEQITLTRADRAKDCQRLISYAMGCMMGRYRLDRPGLIYAHAGNVDFDKIYYGTDTPPFEKGGPGGISQFAQAESQQPIPPNPPFAKGGTFLPDADGIVPITDELWFEDDAANRIREFLLAVWSAETLDENLAWLAESLSQKGNETPIETIRRYLAGSFFKDHLQTYKKRPIYWLFSSGKQGAFQALVYLHRYHESTLARMRAEYVVPLTGKIQSRIEMLEKDAAVAASNATRSKLNKDIEKLKKKHVELLAYDEKLRHYADLRIQLDLDDGVKVNYGKFGDLLAEVKAVTGGAND